MCIVCQFRRMAIILPGGALERIDKVFTLSASVFDLPRGRTLFTTNFPLFKIRFSSRARAHRHDP